MTISYRTIIINLFKIRVLIKIDQYYENPSVFWINNLSIKHTKLIRVEVFSESAFVNWFDLEGSTKKERKKKKREERNLSSSRKNKERKKRKP